MEKASYYDIKGLKKGPWSEEEDDKLRAYIQRYGHWNWGLLPKFAGVSRSGKSCRLRWMNYLRPNMKHGNFTEEEDNIIIDLHNKIGNKWSTIASKLPGRSDNEVKNRWNTRLKKQVQSDQTISGSCGPFQPNNQVNPEVSSVNEHEEACESPSYSPSTDLFKCSMLHRDVNCTDSNDFWSDVFLQDTDSNIFMASGGNLFSPLNYVNDFISQSSCQDLMMNDEFFWSTAMDTYVEDNIWSSLI